MIQFRRNTFVLISIGIIFASLAIFGISHVSSAQEEGFSLQVTPSPLVATVRPGETTELELKIRNTNTQPETLRMGLRSFTVNKDTGEVELSDSIDASIENFVAFREPIFSVEAGEWYTQKLIIAVPEDSGFSYSFATTITRDKQKTTTEGSQIEGSVAVFTLLSVDKPGAVRSFDVTSFSSGKKVYEYLPASFAIKVKNTGNTIVQPTGTLFIQRSSNDISPISTIPINKDGGYVIPESERTFDVEWTDGFPRFEKNGGNNESSLKWDFADASKFRFGKYTAKFVAIYDDGQRDVPVIGELTFWVIPWKQILLAVIALVLMFLGAFYIIRGLLRGIRKKTKSREPTNDSE